MLCLRRISGKFIIVINQNKGNIMREIKFRAWGKENKEIYEPDLIYDGKSAELNKSPDLQDVDSNNDVLMQYTGLKDKNGKEIFEGDICRLDDNEPEDGEIGWIDDG